MQIAFDFVKGIVSGNDFVVEWCQNENLREWIQSLCTPLVIKQLKNLKGSGTYQCLQNRDFSIINCINEYLDLTTMLHEFESYLNIHGIIKDIFSILYPEIIPTTWYHDEYSFFLTVMGDYLGGPEVDDIIWDIVKSYPAEMGKTKRKKAVKEKLKEVFHLEKGHYPIWVQDAEWPAYEGRPMQYVSRKRVGDSDLVLFTFRDVETGKTRIVEQCY